MRGSTTPPLRPLCHTVSSLTPPSHCQHAHVNASSPPSPKISRIRPHDKYCLRASLFHFPIKASFSPPRTLIRFGSVFRHIQPPHGGLRKSRTALAWKTWASLLFWPHQRQGSRLRCEQDQPHGHGGQRWKPETLRHSGRCDGRRRLHLQSARRPLLVG